LKSWDCDLSASFTCRTMLQKFDCLRLISNKSKVTALHVAEKQKTWQIAF
jgi:hypothetical protein